MKFQVKTTALAILVSLGVVGCRSNDTPNQVVEPTPANQASKTDAEKKAEADAKAKAEAEAKAKAAAEAKDKAEAEAKAKAAAEAKAKAEAEAKAKAAAEAKAKAEAEAKAKAEDAKRLEEERKKAEAEAKAKAEAAEKLKPVNLVDKNGVEWRIINIRERGPRNNTTEYLYGGYLDSLRSDFFPEKPKSFFDENGVNAETELNFNELSAKDGKPFLGVHQGKKEDKDFNGKIIAKVLVDKDNRIRVTETIDAKEFNYLYVNQPYSTYGALFTNGHDVKFFSVAKKAGIEDSDMFEYPVYEYEYVEHNGKSIKTGKIIWNDAVAGEATYKGQVIASVVRATMNGDISGIRQAPEIDGTVTLKAQFDKDPERSVVSGEIDSKQVGKIILEKSNISTSSNISGLGKATNEKLDVANNHIGGGFGSGKYSVSFYGKDLNDVVGNVNLQQYQGDVKKGEISRYNAVFGATKQPK